MVALAPEVPFQRMWGVARDDGAVGDRPRAVGGRSSASTPASHVQRPTALPPPPTALDITNVVKRFDTVDALKGVTLRVNAGEAFGLLGPNGAGKSTLISIITTMSPPTSGDVLVNGRSVLREPHLVLRDLGVVFQTPTLDGLMTARENLYIHGRLYKVPKHVLDERIPHALEVARLADRADDRVNTFSGGMRRRLEIVRATLHRPSILLLDEPTVGLDPQSRRAIWEHVARLRRELDMTVLLTTHYLDEADALCERIAIIDHGKIDIVSTPEQLKESLGGDTLELKLDSPLNGATPKVQALANVQAVRADGKDVTITLREPAVTIPRVLDIVHDSGVTVLEMKHKAVSLDDVFVKRTGRSTRDRKRRGNGWAGRLARLLGGA